jgi:hypothetical protein
LVPHSPPKTASQVHDEKKKKEKIPTKVYLKQKEKGRCLIEKTFEINLDLISLGHELFRGYLAHLK